MVVKRRRFYGVLLADSGIVLDAVVVWSCDGMSWIW